MDTLGYERMGIRANKSVGGVYIAKLFQGCSRAQNSGNVGSDKEVFAIQRRSHMEVPLYVCSVVHYGLS